MKIIRKAISILCVLTLLLTLFAGCGNSGNDGEQSDASPSETAGETSTEPVETEGETEPATSTGVTINIGALQGPTGMGMAPLMSWAEAGETANDYNFTIDSAPDVIQGKLVSGELDIAALPANVGAVLYQRTEGEVNLLAINTLGVLYIVQNEGTGVESMVDLAGKTIYTAGQGSTQEYVLNYLLEQNGLTGQVAVDYRSDHAEVANILLEGLGDIALLPQPFVTTVVTRDPTVEVAVDITAEWERVTGGTILTMGSLVIRKGFLDENEDAVNAFLEEYGRSTAFTNSNVDEAAAMIGRFDIVNEDIARAAIPQCNIVCITGSEMRASAEAYLAAIAAQEPAAVGGELPDEGFYYIP